jgi:hypothetical protein
MLCHISLPFHVRFSIYLSYHYVCLFVCLSTCKIACVSYVCLSAHPNTCLPNCVSVYLSKCKFFHLSAWVPIKLLVFPSACLFTYPNACVSSVCLYAYPNACLPICLSVYGCLSLCISFHMFVYPSKCFFYMSFFPNALLSPLSIKMSLFPYLFSSVCLPVKITFIPHVCLSKWLKIHLFVFLSVH